MKAANPQFAKFSRRGASWARSVEIELALERKAIGRRVAALRRQAHLTQEAAADRVGVSTRGYQKWEAGEVMPEWGNLEQLAEVFKVTVDDIIGDADGHGRALRDRPVHDLLGEIIERQERIEAKLDAVLTGEDPGDVPPPPGALQPPEESESPNSQDPEPPSSGQATSPRSRSGSAPRGA